MVFVDHKSHQAVKRLVPHLRRVGFPWDCFAQKNETYRFPFVFHQKGMSDAMVNNAVIRKAQQRGSGIHKVLGNIRPIDLACIRKIPVCQFFKLQIHDQPCLFLSVQRKIKAPR